MKIYEEPGSNHTALINFRHLRQLRQSFLPYPGRTSKDSDHQKRGLNIGQLTSVLLASSYTCIRISKRADIVDEIRDSRGRPKAWTRFWSQPPAESRLEELRLEIAIFHPSKIQELH